MASGTNQSGAGGALPANKGDAMKNSSSSLDYKKKRIGGLKLSLRYLAAAAAVVLFANAGWSIWAWKRYGVIAGQGGHLGFASVYEGNCAQAGRLDTWLHLLINTLSTVLLLGSSSFMQAMSSPTREEVDQAHRRMKWLHIGVLSLRNLVRISNRKACICLLLAISSIPFHLLYNSLIFTSTSANMYNYAVVTPGFLAGETFNITDRTLPYSAFVDTSEIQTGKMLQQAVSSYKRLENADCVSSYSAAFSSSRRNLVLVSTARNQTDISGNRESDGYGSWTTYTGSILNLGVVDEDLGTQLWNSWMCPSLASNIALCDPETIFPNGVGFEIAGFPISYCLSEQTEEICSVRFSWVIMIAVIACNLAKVVAMVYIVFRFEAEELLASVGDAMASYLVVEDPTTRNLQPTTYKSIRTFWRRGHGRIPHHVIDHPGRCKQAASRKRWILFTFLMACALGIVILLLAWGVHYLNSETISPWTLGFGKLNSYALVWDGPTPGIIPMAIVANAPQLILSVLYLSCSAIMTSMFLAIDWNNFSRKKQTLMVSSPSGKQRGTWLLGMPRFPGAVFFAFQVLFHWFVSQSLFAVSIQLYWADGTPAPNAINNCAYSPPAICASLAAAVVLLLSVHVHGLRRLKAGGPPVASTCSAAISAACHITRNPKDERLIYETLQWRKVPGVSQPNQYAFMPAGGLDEESKKISFVKKGVSWVGGGMLFLSGLIFG